jgi:uncharacterized protein with PhoU and TrkA domain
LATTTNVENVMTTTGEVLDLELDAKAAVLKRLIGVADTGSVEATLELAEAYQRIADAGKPATSAQ